jgi:hypothetical protein
MVPDFDAYEQGEREGETERVAGHLDLRVAVGLSRKGEAEKESEEEYGAHNVSAVLLM